MPSVCVVLNCKNKYSQSKNFSYHKFPLKNQEILFQWIKFVNREEGWKPSRWSSICCNHFKPSDFVKVSKQRKRLKRDAVPSILDCANEQNSSNDCKSQNKDLDKYLKKGSDLLIENIEFSSSQDNTCKNIEKSKNAFNSDTKSHLKGQAKKIQKDQNTENIQEKCNGLKEIQCRKNEEKTLNKLNTTSQPIQTQNSPINESIDQEKNNNETSNEKDCRLCGNRCRTVATFLTNFELLGILQKCFPTLNFEQDDNMSKDICSVCLRRLTKYSGFVDDVIKSQKVLQEKYHIEKSTKLSSNPERSLNIKQEPVVNVKQELGEFNSNELNHDLDYSMEYEDELDHKLDFYDLPNLNAQDIIDNCDIMEIINLDDGFIDIPDDEVVTDDNKNGLKFMEDIESYIRKNEVKTVNRSIFEHNYCSTVETDNVQGYKTENNDEDKDFKIPTYLADDNMSITENKFFDNFSVNEAFHHQQISGQPNTILSTFSVQKLMSQSSSNDMISYDSQLTTSKTTSDNIKPSIVVLNESIVKTAEPCGFHSCYFCHFQFLLKIELDNHLRDYHSNPNVSMHSTARTPAERITYPKNTSLQPYTFHEEENPKDEEDNPKEEDDNLKEEDDNLKKKDDNLKDKDDKLKEEVEDLDLLGLSSAGEINDTIQRSSIEFNSNLDQSLDLGPLMSLEPTKINSTLVSTTFPLNPSCADNSSESISPHSFPITKDFPHSANSPIIPFLPVTPNACQILSRNFNCANCPSKFKNFIEYFKHKVKEHTKANFYNKNLKTNCYKCQKVFASKLALRNHINHICDYKNNKRFLYGCKYCNIILNHWRLLKYHHLTCKKIISDQLNKNTKSINKVYSCKYCDKTYLRYQYFKKHELAHLGIVTKPKDYVCKTCKKTFENLIAIKKHQELNKCIKCPQILLHCNICDKQFKNKYLLQTHIMRHNKTKLHSCKKCGKAFAGYNNLLQHHITHINERKFDCNLCHKIFKRRSGLQQHIRGFHLQLKPHICNVCQHRYALKADMMRCRHSDLNT